MPILGVKGLKQFISNLYYTCPKYRKMYFRTYHRSIFQYLQFPSIWVLNKIFCINLYHHGNVSLFQWYGGLKKSYYIKLRFEFEIWPRFDLELKITHNNNDNSKRNVLRPKRNVLPPKRRKWLSLTGKNHALAGIIKEMNWSCKLLSTNQFLHGRSSLAAPGGYFASA